MLKKNICGRHAHYSAKMSDDFIAVEDTVEMVEVEDYHIISQVIARLIEMEPDLSVEMAKVYKGFVDEACVQRYFESHRQNINGIDFIDRLANDILETIAWRVRFGVEDLVSSQLAIALRLGEFYLSPGTGRQGQPILSMIKSETTVDYTSPMYLQAVVYTLELAVHKMKATGASQWIVLCDLSHWSMSNMMPKEFLSQFVSIMTRHYPERLHRAYILNAPWYFSLFWTVFSPLIDFTTRSKICFLSPNASNLEELSNSIASEVDIDNLESRFGGALDFEFDYDEYIMNDSRCNGSSKKRTRTKSSTPANSAKMWWMQKLLACVKCECTTAS